MPVNELAVVVVTYNAASVVGELLDSLPAAADGLERVQLIVVDNDSSDDTVAIVRTARRDATIVETGRNGGYAAGFNAGVAAAAPAHAYALLNPDLVLRPRALTRLVEALGRPEVGIVVPRLENPQGRLLPSLRRAPTVRRAVGEALLGGWRAGRQAAFGELVVDPGVYRERTEADWASGAAMVIDRDCLRTVGPWDESFFLYSEETEFCLRARDRGYQVMLEPDAEAVHIGGDAPQSPRLWALLRTNGVRLFARRHGWLQAQAFRAVVMVGELLRAAVRRREVHAVAWRALASMRLRRRGADAGFRRSRSRSRSPHVLIVVENLPVPLDRRVWLEAQALVEEGYRVSVICPKGPGDPAFEQLHGVHLYKYRPFPQTRGALSFILEFAYCWLATARLTAKVAKRQRIDVFQACNPPDTFFALAALLKPFGTRFVYDQHDLCPEVYMTKFGDEGGLLLRGLFLLERLTYATADHVIATNESYRRVALERGRLSPDQVTVVRNGPDLSRLYRVAPQPELKEGRAHLAVYLGIMGPQDGVDMVIRAAAAMRDEFDRHDVQFALLGFGDSLEDLQRLAEDLGVTDRVTFTGRADDEMIRAYLSTADVGLSPDPPTPFNDASTMNKTMEYMAFGLPVVAFDLTETRVSAGDAAIYVSDGDPMSFGRAVLTLLDDPEEGVRRGAMGEGRVSEQLAWSHQRDNYLAALSWLAAGQREVRQ
ncbi:glycosyltransferase [Egibacter rhizosphaerae]|uniref:glycosyltransferase n=1 Tax=Egibacter rhizosphaerae TaxID=1670831 RepID=UPI00197AD2F1|nr:glycosyltransferase [Egibacter rhizosphaerae]